MFGIKFRRAQVALLVWIAFLLGLVALADSGHARRLFAMAHLIPWGDKLGHFLLMGTLSFLANLYLRAETMRFGGVRWFKGSAIVMSLVTLEECSQVFFRSRTFDLVDLAADAVGVWIFAQAAWHYVWWQGMKLRLASVNASTRFPGA
jgi:polysaccharide biosynthesis protein VpsQ